MAKDLESQPTTKNHAVCFAEALAEELLEVKELRRARKIENPAGTENTKEWKAVEKIAAEAGTRERIDLGGQAAAEDATKVVGEARKMQLAGLAFSGGGIRSATFNLGVLQGLAQYNKVRLFDYLSTVSGGGYIGNWLEAWILRAGKDHAHPPATEAEKMRHGIDVVEEELRPARTERKKSVEEREWQDQKSHTEPPPIRFLRDYSNYLTPRLGALGADTWTVIAIYLRNLLLNQSILVLFLFALLLLPYIAVWLTGALRVEWPWVQPVVALLLLTGALSVGARNLRGLTGAEQKPDPAKPWRPPQQQFWVILTIVTPIFLAGWLLTAWLWAYAETWVNARTLNWPLGGMALLGVPLIISWFFAPSQKDATGTMRFAKVFWMAESLVTGAVSGYLMLAAVHLVFQPVKSWCGAGWHELCLGVPLTMLVFLAAAVVQMGLMGRSFCDPYREWWARVAGWIFILTIVWTAGFALAFYAPLGVLWLRGWLKAAGLAWIGTTLVGVLGGKSEKTGGLDAGGAKVVLLSITPYVFIVGLLSLLSLSLELILARLFVAQELLAGVWHQLLAESPGVEKAVDWVLKVSGSVNSGILTLNATTTSLPQSAAHTIPAYVDAHFSLLYMVTTWGLIPLCAGLLAACVILSYCVDLNEFSMNLMYRNRLVRCYLGATHEKRSASPFSGFDCRDDLFLSTLRSSDFYSGPLPILNGTLNLVNTRDLAWQERKAESFPMTPLRCGFDTWIEQTNLERNYKRENIKGEIAKYAYRPAARYGYADGGFYVGTAMSISGAAASPNMGYHSVPSLALLMTFFNVRLGFWAGNPRNEVTWKYPGPRIGLGQLISELFGLTSDTARYVYLSDGGHFENLGIYELVKRRCKFIVACDAGADPNYTFDDLGSAIRKCREDIGVEIELDTARMLQRTSNDNQGKNTEAADSDSAAVILRHCALGTIHYDMADPDGEKGVLVYIKASLTGDEPSDVRNYRISHPSFPHQSTADQWFSESQFESYRRLGQHVVETLFSQPDGSPADPEIIRKLSPSELFARLEERWPKKAMHRRE
jgi:hypothetical protein